MSTTAQTDPATLNQWHALAQQLRVDSIRCYHQGGLRASDLVDVGGGPDGRADAASISATTSQQSAHPNNDHLIFSKGHASPLLYSVYKAAGAVSDEEMLTLRKFGSRMEGHPTPRAALGGRGDWLAGPGAAHRRGRGAGGQVPRQAALSRLGLLGDSEMAEGSIWEAFELAGHYKLNNMIAILDMNRLGQRGETMLGWDGDAYAARARAFGWHAIEIDGHDLDADRRAPIAEATGAARTSRRSSSPRR